MKTFELNDRTEFFLMENFSFSDKNVADITLDSVFWGQPSTKETSIDRSIVLDSNCFNFIRQHPHGEETQALVNISRELGLMLDPSFALIEQRLRHGNPKNALKEYVASLANNFGIDIGDEASNTFDAHLNIYSDNLRYNISLLRDYLPIIKKLWNQNIPPLEQMNRLANAVILNDLPIFAFALLFAAIAFLAKEKAFNISDKQRSKIQSDMAISPKHANENEKLWNVAFDIGIFMYCVESAIRPKQSPLFLTKIASADKTFQVFSKNIKCLNLTVHDSPTKPIVIGAYFLASGSNISEKMSEAIMELIPRRPSASTSDEKRIRQCNLTDFANETAGFILSQHPVKKNSRSDSFV